MARILVPCTPLVGHLRPALVAGQVLRRRGHRVDVLTATSCEPLVRDHGLGFRPLPPDAVGGLGPPTRTAGWAATRARRDILARFVEPLAAQARALSAALEDGPGYDVVLADTAYLGVLPLLLGPAGPVPRVPVVGLAATPVSTVSVDVPPFGSGLTHADTRFARTRNRQVNWLLHHGPLRPIHEALDQVLAPFGLPTGAANYFDLLRHFDLVLQLSLPELEYPRRDLPASVRCVGPLPVPAPTRWTPPGWWGRLDEAEAVVHVTQGTVDNDDPRRLIVPAVRALRDRGVEVVVTTGRTASASTRQVLDEVRSDSVHVADFVPYDVLLPRTDLMITNGGWGGVQQAARHGVPVIVAGGTEEKVEVGARVAWSGLGLDLRTATPSAGRIEAAVATVLGSERHRQRAAEIASAAAGRTDPVVELVAGVENLCPVRASEPAAPMLSHRSVVDVPATG